MSNLRQQGAKAFIWDFTGKIAKHGMSFVISVILARLLEPSDFGLIALAAVFIGIASIFADMGLGSALIQRRKVLPIHYSSVFYFNLVSSLLLTIIVCIASNSIAGFFNNDALSVLIRVISLTFIINAFSSVQRTKLRRELNYALLTKITLISSLMSGVVSVSLAFASFGVWSLVVQSLLQGLLFNIFIWSKSKWRPSLNFSWKALTQLWGYGFRMFLSGLMESIFTRLDTLVIGKLFSAADLGFFNRAKSLDRMIVKYSSGSLMSVLFPILAKVQRDLPRFQHIFLKSLGIIVFISFFLIGLLYVLSHELILLLYGQKWLQTVDYFKILVLSSFGYPVSALLVNVLSSRGNSRAFLRLEIYKKIIGLLNLIIAFRWGIEGYLYGYLAAMSLAVYLNVTFVHKEIFIPIWKIIRPVLIQGVLTLGIVLIVQSLNKYLFFQPFTKLVFEGLMFSLLYLILNKYLGIRSYVYFISEAMPVCKKIYSRIKI
ncbi:lipopolysaccharide biosynthesis protein [Nitratifractor salsuginis]|uniref:Polysaccharide biosynthesis protein n=1 Tax=Nitratifractor salsuginis (strain DSM 16511 / JCM 12458 / E9I37-1) TaxID=749222 RepID=E6X1B0_NITSE|nr:lipopolysaccharide biosynthesis protein [Nitratifractor salsuginis]ADV46972.1 polysaccharide biosynthesis protein [Nitratifractor salsuginis DSM 16511]